MIGQPKGLSQKAQGESGSNAGEGNLFFVGRRDDQGGLPDLIGQHRQSTKKG